MTDPTRIRTPLAEKAFAVANTPLFLLRKLRSDPAVLEISQTVPPGTIFAALKDSLRRSPKTLSDAVQPYVYLVALSLTRDLQGLKEAAQLEAPYADWFAYIAKVLVDTYQPTVLETIQVPNTVISFGTTSKSSAPTAQQTINLGS